MLPSSNLPVKHTGESTEGLAGAIFSGRQEREGEIPGPPSFPKATMPAIFQNRPLLCGCVQATERLRFIDLHGQVDGKAACTEGRY